MDFPVFEQEGTTTIIEGKRRTGKTLLVAILSLLYADNGTRVYSNFTLDTPNYHPISFYQFVTMLNRDRPFNPFILVSLQEIQGWLSSHRSMSDTSEIADNLIFQASKLGINIIGDTQLNMRVGNSLRGTANYRFEAEKDELAGCFTYWELDSKYPNDSVRTEENFSIPFELAEYFWNRYHTYQPSKPLGMGALLGKMEKLEPVLMNASINRQVALILANNKQKHFDFNFYLDVNKISVEDALLQLGEEIVFSSYVTERLKKQLKYKS